jgi:hypothetical protein
MTSTTQFWSRGAWKTFVDGEQIVLTPERLGKLHWQGKKFHPDLRCVCDGKLKFAPDEEFHACLDFLFLTLYMQQTDLTNSHVTMVCPGEAASTMLFTPTKTESLPDLPKVKSGLIINGSWRVTSNKDYTPWKFVSWPEFWFTGQHLPPVYLESWRDWGASSKHFVSMNNRERLHRNHLHDILVEKDLLQYGTFSYLERGIKIETDPRVDFNYTPEMYIPGGAIDIVTETEYEDHIRWTEKTVRPLLAKKPFIILGERGTHKALTELGFQLYDFIDYSFDDIADWRERHRAALDELERLIHTYTPYDLCEMEKEKKQANHLLVKRIGYYHKPPEEMLDYAECSFEWSEYKRYHAILGEHMDDDDGTGYVQIKP